MPIYKSNLFLNLTLKTASSAESTEEFSEEVSQEIYEVLENHLQEAVDHYDISTDALLTELVSTTPEYTPLVSSSEDQEDYVSLQSLNARSQSTESSYTPLVR